MAGRWDKKPDRGENRRAAPRRGRAPSEASTSMPMANQAKKREIVIRKRKREGRRRSRGRAATRVCREKFIQRLIIALKPACVQAHAWRDSARLQIGVRADLDAIEIVRGGRDDESEEIFLLERVGHGQSVAFARERGDLEHDRALGHLRRLDSAPAWTPPLQASERLQEERRGRRVAIGGAC